MGEFNVLPTKKALCKYELPFGTWDNSFLENHLKRDS